MYCKLMIKAYTYVGIKTIGTTLISGISIEIEDS
jgi:hypothetical protein